mmetsp:Transcript_122560/g.240532  ORF Transcript_122560/g.240532 Transcript_122560/m.240532 type:complete len:360 (+) Transcript_122560:76-1155(+)
MVAPQPACAPQSCIYADTHILFTVRNGAHRNFDSRFGAALTQANAVQQDFKRPPFESPTPKLETHLSVVNRPSPTDWAVNHRLASCSTCAPWLNSSPCLGLYLEVATAHCAAIVASAVGGPLAVRVLLMKVLHTKADGLARDADGRSCLHRRVLRKTAADVASTTGAAVRAACHGTRALRLRCQGELRHALHWDRLLRRIGFVPADGGQFVHIDLPLLAEDAVRQTAQTLDLVQQSRILGERPMTVATRAVVALQDGHHIAQVLATVNGLLSLVPLPSVKVRRCHGERVQGALHRGQNIPTLPPRSVAGRRAFWTCRDIFQASHVFGDQQHRRRGHCFRGLTATHVAWSRGALSEIPLS